MERRPHRRGTRDWRSSPDRRRLATAEHPAAAEARATALRQAVGADRAGHSTTEARLSPPRARLAIAAAAAAGALVMATQLVDFAAWDLRVRALDSSYEWSYSHLLSTVGIALSAAMCATAGAAPGSRRRQWRTAAVLLGLLLADNVTRLHEHVPHWPLFYGPVVLGLGAAVVRAARGRPGARLVVAAIGLLGLSMAIHVTGPSVVSALGWGPDSLAYQVKVALKEGTELGGWTMLLAALARLTGRPVRF